jgi:hypothetical protein
LPVASNQLPVSRNGILRIRRDAFSAGNWPLATGNCIPLAIAFQGGSVRKYLGVMAVVTALCVMSWAQAPAQSQAPDQTPAQAPAQAQPPEATPIPAAPPAKVIVTAPPFPRLEFFAGGSYAEAGLFNAGHWAGLPGWDASLGLNFTHWLGFLIDGGEYFGTSQIPVAVPEPFPPSLVFPSGATFNVDTREYNILFGLEFARRKSQRWTPFGELLYGHQGTRGIATPLVGSQVAEVSSGRAIVVGGGIDHKITERFALRLKADYLETGSFKQKQDNFRFSVGIVIRSVKRKRRRLEDETEPEP